ncbi:sortilin-like isoform X1 [Acipenser ruthenus]|uniref:sortilin-like isoform X1 n=1 Tax=Acipenser ruthenus TaxID=7906 RepID=UPI00145A198A|nr:sortilin-like isoform X1 [Acipenser ruthenus]
MAVFLRLKGVSFLDLLSVFCLLTLFISAGGNIQINNVHKTEHSGEEVLRSVGDVISDEEKPSKADAQGRLHPGLIVAVVIVAFIAVLAAAFIIRKYCFPQSNATYRYSVLRRNEEWSIADELDNNTASRRLYNDDSDEGMLE